MKELQAWLDNAPTLRGCVVEFDGTWSVKVYYRGADLAGPVGIGQHHSLTFATVAALIDLAAKED